MLLELGRVVCVETHRESIDGSSYIEGTNL
jgi:hypothetical protein